MILLTQIMHGERLKFGIFILTREEIFILNLRM